jgi:hypothetical protein
MMNFFKNIYYKIKYAIFGKPPVAIETPKPAVVGNLGSLMGVVRSNDPKYIDQLSVILKELRLMFEDSNFADALVSHMQYKLKYPDELISKVFRALYNIKSFDLNFFYGSYMQNRVWKTNGYVNGKENPIYVNTYFAVNNGALLKQMMMGLMIHESLHLAGWTHADEAGRNIPYDIGDFVFERSEHYIS